MLKKINSYLIWSLFLIIYLVIFNYFGLFNSLPKKSFSIESLPIVIIFFLSNLFILQTYVLKNEINTQKIILVWLLLLVPYLRFIFTEIFIDEQSDPSRYYTYAKQIIEYKTINGNPLNTNGYLIDQPFYRYYLIPFILIFGKLNYFFLFFNLTIYLYLTSHFLKYLKRNIDYKYLNYLIVIYFCVSSIYVSKNILSVQLEWLCIVFSYLIFFAYINKKTFTLFLLLSLIALQRQNFVLIYFFISFFYIYENFYENKKYLFISFLVSALILLFPLIHNLFFAVSEFKFRYFSLNIGLLFLQNPNAEIQIFSNRDFTGLFSFIMALKSHIIESIPVLKIRLLEFVGIEIREGYTTYQKVFGLIVCPLAISIIIYIFSIVKLNYRVILLLLIVLIILPLFILGDGNWPRFQYLSYHSTIIFISIWINKIKKI